MTNIICVQVTKAQSLIFSGVRDHISRSSIQVGIVDCATSFERCMGTVMTWVPGVKWFSKTKMDSSAQTLLKNWSGAVIYLTEGDRTRQSSTTCALSLSDCRNLWGKCTCIIIAGNGYFCKLNNGLLGWFCNDIVGFSISNNHGRSWELFLPKRCKLSALFEHEIVCR